LMLYLKQFYITVFYKVYKLSYKIFVHHLTLSM
jgi:hypothetical protein